MQDVLRDQVCLLLDHVKKEIKKNKKHRPYLTIDGDRQHLVGVVEFQDISTLMVVKLLLEYNTQDYTFTWNRNLYRHDGREYIVYNDKCLVILSVNDKNKVKSFLKFLKTFKKDVSIFLMKMRSNWIRVTEIGFITYLRKNVYLCHKDPKVLRHPMFTAMEELCRGEDVFWRHVLVLLKLVPENYQEEHDIKGTIKISRGNACDRSAWNFILVTPNYQHLVEDNLKISVVVDAKTHEEVVGICELSAGHEDPNSFSISDDEESSSDEEQYPEYL